MLLCCLLQMQRNKMFWCQQFQYMRRNNFKDPKTVHWEKSKQWLDRIYISRFFKWKQSKKRICIQFFLVIRWFPIALSLLSFSKTKKWLYWSMIEHGVTLVTNSYFPLNHSMVFALNQIHIDWIRVNYILSKALTILFVTSIM